jgi:hypothetical protein
MLVHTALHYLITLSPFIFFQEYVYHIVVIIFSILSVYFLQQQKEKQTNASSPYCSVCIYSSVVAKLFTEL